MEQTRIAAPHPQTIPGEAIDEVREQIIDQIPVTLAWRCGDRLYVRAAKGSPLANRIRSLGARWDRRQGGLALDESSLDGVKAVLADSAARMAIAADLRAGGGVAIDIPYKANGLWWRARMLGGIWDATTKTWLVPATAAPQLLAELEQWHQPEQPE